MKTINITIDMDGTVEIDVVGFTGRSCKDVTKEIEKALGVVNDEKKKAEYYQQERRKVNVRY